MAEKRAKDPGNQGRTKSFFFASALALAFLGNDLIFKSMARAEVVWGRSRGPAHVRQAMPYEVMDTDNAGCDPSSFPRCEQKTMGLGTYIHRMNGSPTVKWDGCAAGAKIKAGYGNARSCTTIDIHRDFGRHMDKHFLRCSQEAARKAGVQVPEKIHISHMGCYANRKVRNGSRPSLHAYARALDIGAITLITGSSRVTMSMHARHARHGKQNVFYEELRACWKRSLPRSCARGRESSGSVGYKGSKGLNNSLHNDHLHLSYPTCASELY